jgi:hypothetical protein
VGLNDGTVTYSYATGAVTGVNFVGGLVALNNGTVSNSYATGSVTGGSSVGGLVGYTGGSVSNNYWAKETGLNSSLWGIDSMSSNTGATPKTLAELKQAITYDSSWDFTLGTGVWGVNGTTKNGQINNGLPFFQWQYPVVASFKADNQTVQYGNTGTSPQYTATYASGYNQTSVLGSGVNPTLTRATSNVNAGSTNVINISAAPASSLADKDAVMFLPGLETISKRQITVSANNLGTSTYGNTVTFANNGESQTINGDTLGGTASYTTGATKSTAGFYNKGDWKYNLTLSGYNENYAVSYGTDANFSISAKAITVTANNLGTSTYGNNVTFTNNGQSQVLSGDTLGGTASYTTGATTSTAGYYNKGTWSYNLTLSGFNENYSVSYGIDASFKVDSKKVTAATLNGSVSKTYDGTNTVNTTDTGYSGLAITSNDILSGDSGVKLTTSGYTYSSKSVGTGLTITSGALSLSGNSLGNYELAITPNSVSNTNGTINAKTLLYVANAASRTAGEANPAFSGSVTGFVTGESIANATTGTLLFSSSADSNSAAGVYAILGSGLSSLNYLFAQATGNSTALRVNAAVLPQSTVTVPQSTVTVPQNTVASPAEAVGIEIVPVGALSDTFRPLGPVQFAPTQVAPQTLVNKPFTLVFGEGSDEDNNELARSSSFIVPE